MKKLICTLLILSSALYADFSHNDFQITPPKADSKLSPNGPQVAIFFLPPMDNFQANVNVQKQAFKGTIEEYKNISMGQFTKMKFTLISQNLSQGVFTVEYTGNMQNRDFQWYSKAVKKGDYVYLVTGAAPKRTWQYQGDKIKASVNSFKLK
ncbi:hypothetical protein LNTAR_23719 [Lentisphaera araneosa HTCC2155]|uniref:Uncharacterized protein n=1 Tax=Lentisphaera araneosa HTCC2155 TaxID=313628 RepID=A6DS71_9BACT|nr:hypothetical protein [Lentisphaera araneosa]EDM25531.1 hypothetical protein LNTAR_23719 [Lentisphaera araneosa HTCC2155]